MNDFSDEINKILRLAGVQLNEEQGYFTDWKSIKDKVVKMYIRSRLEETGMLEDDEWFIQQWIEDNASADMIEKIYDECGTTDIYWASAYINKNADAGGIITQVVKGMVGEYFDRISNDLQKEFEQNNLIYRMIDSDKSPKEIAQILKTNGTGNCWAKQEENAKAYYGGNNYNEYCLIGEATMDNVNWETTIFLRMMAEEENEVRLKKDSPIHIVGIKYYHFNEDNKIDKKDHMKVDMMLNVGHSYVFNESVKALDKEYNTTKLVTSPYELNQILINNNEMRVIYDKIKKWYIIGNPENVIHYDMLRDAMANGLYTMNDGFGRMMDGSKYEDGKNYYGENKDNFIMFRTSSDINNDEDFIYDGYRYCYQYKDYCVFDRNNDFTQTTLYQILGKPIYVNYFGNDDEELDESIAYSEMIDDDMFVILHNPTRKELRDNNLDGECRIVNDGNDGYYFASSELTHEQIENKLKSKGLPYNETMGEFYYYQDNLFATRDDWNTEEEYQEYKNDWYKSLKSIPYIVKNFGDFKAEIFNGEYLTEEIIHAEKSNYDDYMAVVLKNPTKRELRENGLYRSRFICFEDGTWLFFDSMQWIHEQILSKYRSNSRSVGMGFYDYNTNEFIFMESMNHDEGEEGYDEEVSYYENKCKKWLLTKPYIRETFGLNPNVTVYGDWVDSPW